MSRSRMTDWKSFLKGDPTDWLLGSDNPSVRYFALTDIMGEPGDSSGTRRARREIMLNGPVPRILARQNAGGHWEDPNRFYVAKYRGTVWQLMILAELGADPGDPRVQKACEFILDRSQHRASGGFSVHQSARSGDGLPGEVIPCLTGNMVWSLIRLGFLNDPRLRQGIDWIVRYQRFDDGAGAAPQGWPYDRYEMCWGRHVCHMGVVKALKALAEIPARRRSRAVSNKIEEGVEFILRHRVHKRSHDPARISRPGWLRFGFPLMYQTDVLEILNILTGLGYRDERMQEAVDAVLKRQDDQGRWTLKSTFNGRFIVDIERKGKPSKWITLNALRVLKSYFSC
jgi:hypothetical protein